MLILSQNSSIQNELCSGLKTASGSSKTFKKSFIKNACAAPREGHSATVGFYTDTDKPHRRDFYPLGD
jgi:hypothetical protein